MKKNEEFELKITDLSDEGAGIGRTYETGPEESGAGFIWFVKDAMIGDRIIAAATKIKKNYGFARLIRILESSPDRVTPPCPEARRCGGCQIQQMSYGAQLKFKENKVLNDLVRIGGFDPAEFQFDPIIGMEDPWRYRNKAVYPVGRDRDGRLIAGFYAGRTHSIISCEDCLLGEEQNRDILRVVLQHMEENHIAPYDEENHSGTVRHILIRKGRHTGELMISIVINADRLKTADELGMKLKAAFPELKSFSLCVNRERTNVIMGTELINVLGPGYIEDKIREIVCEPDKASAGYSFADAGRMPVSFKISPLSFFQVNPSQMERLYGTALEFAGLSGQETVWDLYCGVGTISLFLSRHAKKAYGVEVIPAAIENAKENAELNHITNTEFFVGRAEDVLPQWFEKQQAAADKDAYVDVIVVDPPRKGCDIRCLETMTAIGPERIVYVSCDPATLARDLKYLCGHGYELKKVRTCDMFPHTVHVETVCLLSKKNAKPKDCVEISVDAEDYYRIKSSEKDI